MSCTGPAIQIGKYAKVLTSARNEVTSYTPLCMMSTASSRELRDFSSSRVNSFTGSLCACFSILLKKVWLATLATWWSTRRHSKSLDHRTYELRRLAMRWPDDLFLIKLFNIQLSCVSVASYVRQADRQIIGGEAAH